jgi:hypothetical protein
MSIDVTSVSYGVCHMSITSFLEALFADGRVRVGPENSFANGELRNVDDLLLGFERVYRDDLPGSPPPLSLAAARHGAILLYRICQFLVFRDLDGDTIHRELNRDLQEKLSPSVHYSVDLILRFLPDAMKLARAKSSDDPLVSESIRLAKRWPLSSVGIVQPEQAVLDTFIEDSCLARLYVDRILARGALELLADDRVRGEAECAIGAFPELAFNVAEIIDRKTTPSFEGETGK